MARQPWDQVLTQFDKSKIEQITWKWTESGDYYNMGVFYSKDVLGIYQCSLIKH